ncbi:MAG: VTT domain-containing protein [Bacteroidetes bacterium]|nr:VTT domain-containing protein [Bacteroidota bacterium]
METEDSKFQFLIKNLIKGLAWFAVIIVAYLLVQKELNVYREQISKVGNNMFLLLTIFTVSEIVFGILPPEIFMLIWKTMGDPFVYTINLAILTFISYGAGVVGYFIGLKFSKLPGFRTIHERWLAPYDRQLRKYGGFLVIVGAVTPVPFSATCMLAGSVNLPFRQFLLITISRIVRFAFYGSLVWFSTSYQ